MNGKINPSRLKLIDGAMHVLSVEGVSGATTRKIAEAAGVRLATLHYHFKDKDELLFAVLEEVTRLLEQFLDEDVQKSDNLFDCIRELIMAIWRLVRKTKDLQIVQFEMTMYAVRRPGTAWLAERQYEGYITQYERILGASNHGLLGTDDLRDLAHFLLAGLDGIQVQDLATADKTRSDKLLVHLVEASQSLARHMAANQSK